MPKALCHGRETLTGPTIWAYHVLSHWHHFSSICWALQSGLRPWMLRRWKMDTMSSHAQAYTIIYLGIIFHLEIAADMPGFSYLRLEGHMGLSGHWSAWLWICTRVLYFNSGQGFPDTKTRNNVCMYSGAEYAHRKYKVAQLFKLITHTNMERTYCM